MKAPKQLKSKAAKTIVAPALSLTPSVGRVKQKDVISVKVEFEGLDDVALSLEPQDAFTLDLSSMSRSGTLRMKGLADGTTTLIASGRVGGQEVVRKVLHLYCEGPTVRIVAYGYIPFEG